MVEIGEGCGRKTVALITDMSVPLGNAIGNSLEIVESIAVLKGEGPADLTEICEALASEMLYLAEKGSLEDCRALVRETIHNGSALQKLADMVEAQGGDRAYIEAPDRFPAAAVKLDILVPKSGSIESMDTEGIGIAAMLLGAGRERADDSIDYSAGIILTAKTGDSINEGQRLATLHTSDRGKAEAAAKKFQECISFADTASERPTLLHERICFE